MNSNDYTNTLYFLDDFEFDALLSLTHSTQDDFLRQKIRYFLRSFDQDDQEETRNRYYSLLDYLEYAQKLTHSYQKQAY